MSEMRICDEESINHALFEWATALQTCALSDIPSVSLVFPGWANLDYLLWQLPKRITRMEEKNILPWILWFIWKAQNDKVYNNINRHPPYILRNAMSEAEAWWNAQDVSDNCTIALSGRPIIEGKVCIVDGSWKSDSSFSGLGWICANHDGSFSLLGAKGQRRSLSALHAKLEVLLWAMEGMLLYQEVTISFQTNSLELVKMVANHMD